MIRYFSDGNPRKFDGRIPRRPISGVAGEVKMLSVKYPPHVKRLTGYLQSVYMSQYSGFSSRHVLIQPVDVKVLETIGAHGGLLFWPRYLATLDEVIRNGILENYLTNIVSTLSFG